MLCSLLLEAPNFLAMFPPLRPLSPHVQLILIYVENMLKLESGAIGDLVGRTMLVAIMDKLIDLDVSCLKSTLHSGTV